MADTQEVPEENWINHQTTRVKEARDEHVRTVHWSSVVCIGGGAAKRFGGDMILEVNLE